MDLFLVRHAVAADRDPEAWPDDSVRPLTADGVERFRSAARGLRRLVPAVDSVLASPYARAWRTAELLAEEAGWPAPGPCDELAASRDPLDALGLLERAGSSLALVGHEPFLSSLAALLLTGDPAGLAIELKKGGVLALAVDGAGGTLRWHLTPKQLRLLDR